MGIEEWIAIISVVIALVSLAVHLRLNHKQSRASALIQIYSNNRELLSMGFDHPELFEILSNGQEEDFPRRYLQMWLNQMALIFQLKSQGAFTADQWQALTAEIYDFMENPAMRSHWQPRREYYPATFRDFIDHILTKIEDKKKAAALLQEPPPD